MGEAGETRARPRAEPPWVMVANAVITHGGLEPMNHKEFYALVERKDGRARPVETTCEGALKHLVEVRHEFLRKSPIRFGPGAGLVLGISLGTESLRAAIVDANGAIPERSGPVNGELLEGADPERHAFEAQPLPCQLEQPRSALLDRIVWIAHRVASDAVKDERLCPRRSLPLLGVAVAWPSPIDRIAKTPTGTLLNDSAWREDPPVSLEKHVADRLGLDVERSHALNDANAIALAAAFKAIRATPELPEGRFGGTFLALRIGGGLGAGTVISGSDGGMHRSRFIRSRLIEGTDGSAGELGHWQVSKEDIREVTIPLTGTLKKMPKLACSCGRPSCLQTYASVGAFVERMKKSSIGIQGLDIDGRRSMTSVMHEAMHNVHSEEQRRAQTDIGRLIGRSLAAPILMLNPQSVTLTGSLAVNLVADGIGRERERWQHPHSEPVRLDVWTGHENKFAAVRGAALAVFRGRLYRRLDELGTAELPWTELNVLLDQKALTGWLAKGARGPED